ncbi:MAG: hypothetical protein WA133_05840 [Syntrophales bacterium]
MALWFAIRFLSGALHAPAIKQLQRRSPRGIKDAWKNGAIVDGNGIVYQIRE